MGGGETKTTNVENRDPWSGQQPYLQNAFSEAQSIYNTQKGQNAAAYTGDFYAKPTSQMTNAFQQALQFGSGPGAQAANQAVQTGTQNAQMGTQGTQQAMGGLFGLAGQDATANNINAASQYANNPYMDGMVDASMRDARRQVSEQALPGLNRNAAATGNMNSSRTGVAQGIIERGLAEKTADVSSQLRGQAYQSGITQAQQDTQNKMGALQGAGAMAGNATSTGLSGMNAGVDMNKTNTDNAMTSTTMLNGFDQQVIDNELAKYDYQQQLPWKNLNNFYNIIGASNWGGTTTSVGTKKEPPSTISTLGMGLGVLGSLMKCDRRTKTDIREVGVGPANIPLYVFRYIGSNDYHVGPMAQEVEQVYPDAVVEIDGVKHIDLTKYDWRT